MKNSQPIKKFKQNIIILLCNISFADTSVNAENGIYKSQLINIMHFKKVIDHRKI